MIIRALIVDDEPLARRGIRVRLERTAGIEIAGECEEGDEAVVAIRDLRPDLVFLDVQMPGLDGFGVVEAVAPEKMPVTIFVTAYDEHALRAFDACALDYLLKPIDDERFARAVTRARRQIEQAQASELGRRLARVVAEFGAVPGAASTSDGDRKDPVGAIPVSRFIVSSGGRLTLVPADEIDWVEAAGNYVSLHVGKATHLLRETMADLEKKLEPDRFVRIHRSTIVNIERVRTLEPYFNREFIVTLHDGTKLKLSRNYRDRLDALLGHMP